MPRKSVEVEVEMLRAPRAKRPRRRKGTDARDDHPRHRQVRSKDATADIKGTRKLCPPINVCGQRYRILVDDAYSSKKIEGACTWADNLIELLDQAEDRMHDTLLHEIFHAITDASGLKWTIANRFKKLSLKDRRDLDEMLCRFLAPAILSTLREAGWLKLPRATRHRRA